MDKVGNLGANPVGQTALPEWRVDGPMPVASCITIAAETGIAVRTLFEARARLPIACDRIGDGKGRPGVWRLEHHAPSPRGWRRRKLQFCAGCGELMVGEHWRRRRCRRCGGR